MAPRIEVRPERKKPLAREPVALTTKVAGQSEDVVNHDDSRPRAAGVGNGEVPAQGPRAEGEGDVRHNSSSNFLRSLIVGGPVPVSAVGRPPLE